MDPTLKSILDAGETEGYSPVEMADAVKSWRNDSAQGIFGADDDEDVRLTATRQLDADAQSALKTLEGQEYKRHWDTAFEGADDERSLFSQAFEDSKYDPMNIQVPPQATKNWKGIAQGIKGVNDSDIFDLPESGRNSTRGGKLMYGDTPVATYDSFHDGQKPRALIKFSGEDSPAMVQEQLDAKKKQLEARAQSIPDPDKEVEMKMIGDEVSELEERAKKAQNKPLSIELPDFNREDVTSRIEFNKGEIVKQEQMMALAQQQIKQAESSGSPDAPDMAMGGQAQLQEAKKRMEELAGENQRLSKEGIRYLQSEYVREEILKPENKGRIPDKGLLQDLERGAVKLALDTGTSALVGLSGLGNEWAKEKLPQQLEAQQSLETVMPGAIPRHMEGGFGNRVMTGVAENLPMTAAILGTGGATALAAGAKAGSLAPLLPMYASSYGGKYGAQMQQADELEAQGRPEDAKKLRDSANLAAHVSALTDTATEMINPLHAPLSRGVPAGFKKAAKAMIQEGPVEEGLASIIQNAAEPLTSQGVNQPGLFEGLPEAVTVGSIAALPFGAVAAFKGDKGQAISYLQDFEKAKPEDPDYAEKQALAKEAYAFLAGDVDTRLANLAKIAAEKKGVVPQAEVPATAEAPPVSEPVSTDPFEAPKEAKEEADPIASGFTRAAAENPDLAESITDTQKLIESPLKQWKNAFSGVQFTNLGGSGIAVSPDGTLLLDIPTVAKSVKEGGWTGKSLEAAIHEEVLHRAVDLATSRMLGEEEVTPTRVAEQHAWDWENLPGKVRQESERLYRLNAIEKARKLYGGELSEDQINQVVAAIPSTDAYRGAEFKRQVMQGRIFGVLTEEAQANPGFSEWLKNFLNQLLASIKQITSQITDPASIQKLDDLEREVRSELQKIGGPIPTQNETDITAKTSPQVGGTEAPQQPPQSAGRILGESGNVASIDEIVSKLEASARVPNLRPSDLAREVESLAGSRIKELAEALGYKANSKDIAVQMLMEAANSRRQTRAQESAPLQETTPIPDEVSAEGIGERALTTAERLEKRGKGEEAPEGTRPEDVEAQMAPEPVIPERPHAKVSFNLWQEMDAMDATLQSEALDEAWTSYYIAEKSFEKSDAEIARGWADEMTDPESAIVFQGVMDVKRARRGTDYAPVDVEREPSDLRDAEYMKAVRSGDMETAQRMVDEAAKAAGYNSPKVFHGTEKQFDEFSPSTIGKMTGANTSGFWFSDNKEASDFYHSGEELGGRTISAYLRIQNPLMVSDEKFASTSHGPPFWLREAISKGHDGVILEDIVDGDMESTVYAVPGPSQIKSADPVTRDASGEVIPLSRRFNPESNDIRFASEPVMPDAKEQAKAQLASDFQTLARESFRDPDAKEEDKTKAHKDERTIKVTGEEVEFARPYLPDAVVDAAVDRILENAAILNGGMGKKFGKMVLDYLRGEGAPEGLQDSPLFKIRLAIKIQQDSKLRKQLGIKEKAISPIVSTILTQAGSTLQSASNGKYYVKQINDLAEEMQKEPNKKLKELGIEDPEKLVDDLNDEKDKIASEGATELAKVVGAFDFSSVLPLFDEKRRKALVELQSILEEMASIQQELASLPDAQSAPEPAGAANRREELQNRLNALTERANVIIDSFNEAITGTKPKPKKRTPTEVVVDAGNVVAAAEEEIARANFKEWVGGKEQEGIPSFKDLMLDNIGGGQFNREAFAESLQQKFEDLDPEFIEEVTNEIGDAIEGRTEEDEAKAPDYDGRAKTIVANAVKRDAFGELEKVQDPLSKLVKKRLKNEITPQQFMEEVQKLGVEPMTAFALNRKVELDMARIEQEKGAKKVKAELERSTKEADSMIESLNKKFQNEFSGDKIKAQKTISELRALVNSFMGKSGPAITDEQFLDQAKALNIPEPKAKALLDVLTQQRMRQSSEAMHKVSETAKKKRKSAINKTIESLKAPKVKDLPKRNKFLNALIGAYEADVLDAQAVRDALAQAYDMHGLTTVRLEQLGKIIRDIEQIPDDEVRGTLQLLASGIINELSAPAKITDMLHSALRNYVLSGAGTIFSQFSQISRSIIPFLGAWHTLAMSDPGSMKTPLGVLRLRQLFKVWAAGLDEAASAKSQILAGVQGFSGGRTYGLNVNPTRIEQMRPGGMSIQQMKRGDLHQYRIGKGGGFFGGIPASKTGQKWKRRLLTPMWWGSRTLNLIRAAEAYTGAIEKNMTFRALATAHLMSKGMTWDDAWNKVSDMLTPETNSQMWYKAMEQAKKDLKEDMISKHQLESRANSIVQNQIDKEWETKMADQAREVSALVNFKSEPLTALGDLIVRGVGKAGEVIPPVKMFFLFPKFFVNAYEATIRSFPIAGRWVKGSGETAQNPREKRIEAIYGSMQKYRDMRKAEAAGSEAATVAAGLALALSYALWKWLDEDETGNPPIFWITGSAPTTKQFSQQAQMKETWWQPNTLYFGPFKFNYVQSIPNYSMMFTLIGNYADRVMFSELLNYGTNRKTERREFQTGEVLTSPSISSFFSPMTRSTFADFHKAGSGLIEGNAKPFFKLLGRPIGGAAAGMVTGGPFFKDLDKMTKGETPKASQDWKQAFKSGIPFASWMGLDTGLEMRTPFGQKTTPYSYVPLFSQSQVSSDEVKSAAKILNDVGISKEGVTEFMLDEDLIELSVDGKRYLFTLEERGQVLSDIGTTFARAINDNKDKIKTAKEKSHKEAQKVVNKLSDQSRERVLNRWRSKIKPKED